MDAITFSGRTDVRKATFTVASLLSLPALMITIPILSPGPFLYGLIAFWVFATIAALLPFAHTVYRIENGQLVYRSGLRWGSVPIDRIHSITRETSILSANASASFVGLRIQFFVGEVFVAPQNEEEFVAALRRINSTICSRGL